MNNVNMGGMNAMGGPVGGGMTMMNNGAPGGGLRQMPGNESGQRSQLNTYIYDYFLRNDMFECARALYENDKTMKVINDSPREDGEDADSKDNADSKRPRDLPRSDVPRECPESCFLYEWWCLFWDMFNAQRGKGDGRTVLQYVNHTQTQSRIRQEHQQNLLRGLRVGGDIMPQQYQQMLRMNQATNGGMNINQHELRQKAMQNNRNSIPQQQMMLAQQKQQAMQRDPSGGDQQRAGSPGSVENAPSPSKRPRLDGAGFNPQQMQNGRGQPIPPQVGEPGPSNAIQAAHMQLTNGIESHLTAQQFQNMPGGPNNAQARTLAGYQAGMVQQQASQMPTKGMQNPGGPPNQGSPMMNPNQDGGAITGYYNAGEMGQNGNMRNPAGQQAGGGGNHALQDYQMQLMLLEQQNKKRLMMARQEQDNNPMPGQGREGGAPGMGPNGQPFQGTSPQGARSVNSPNPTDQMKRGTPHMNPAGMPSPVPEGQSRGSPSGMNFMPGGQMDPNMSQQYFMKNGMDPNMAGGIPNGMRPPSSHPGGFTGQTMTPNQMQMANAQRQQVANANWQNGQNGQMMAGPNQGVPQPMGQGTPQQRPMAPPAAPGAVANGRTQPSSPQQNPAPPTPSQTNKTAPKKKNDGKDTKAKRGAAKKGSAPATSATPSADPTQEPATPTPATPITPVHPKTFTGQNGAVQPVTNGQPTAPMITGVASLQPDPLQNGFSMDNTTYDFPSLDFNGNVSGNTDVLQDFDFDSFLHNDADVNDNYNFDTSGFMEGNEIGTE